MHAVDPVCACVLRRYRCDAAVSDMVVDGVINDSKLVDYLGVNRVSMMLPLLSLLDDVNMHYSIDVGTAGRW
jgi:hypothetical protein